MSEAIPPCLSAVFDKNATQRPQHYGIKRPCVMSGDIVNPIINIGGSGWRYTGPTDRYKADKCASSPLSGYQDGVKVRSLRAEEL